MSTLAVNTITNAAGGNTAQINGMTPTADSLQGFRNRIINGGMVIDQRNAGASVTPTNGQYLVDRFFAIQSTASKYSAQQNAGAVTPPTGFSNYQGATSLSAYSSASGDQFYIAQRIEASNIGDLAFGTANAQAVTVSFWVRSSLTGTHSGSLINPPTFNRSYPFTFTVSAANTWEFKTVVIPGDTSGTWATSGTGSGLQVAFNLGTGSSFVGTAGAWNGNVNYGVTGAVSVVGTSGATFYLTGVQLEAGSVATPFERRPFGTELQLCLRYYQNSFDVGNKPGVSTSLSDAIHLVSFGDGNCGGYPFQVPMRAAPTVTLRAQGSTTTGQVSSGGTDRSATASNIGSKQVSFINVTSGAANTFTRFTWEAASEL
jgi:hypothetical protein